MTGKFIVANSIRQFYEINGEAGNPWITLIHGSGDNHLAWELQIADLSNKYRVLTYDVRGHGATETPFNQEVSQTTLIEDLHELLRALNIENTGLIGYSMGAGIARNYAAVYPEKIWGLVLSNGGKIVNKPSDDKEKQANLQSVLDRKNSIKLGGMESVFDGWISSVYTPEFVLAKPDIVEWHRNIMTSNNVDKYIHVVGAIDEVDFDLGEIDMPSLIIVGAGDEYTGPEEAKELANALTGTQAEVNIFPTRHGSPFERHMEYNQTINKFFQTIINSGNL
jgi:pimeloyl-ACP methyl ester carboxylesterase